MEPDLIERIVAAVLRRLAPFCQMAQHPRPIPVGISGRHVHLAAADLAALYGAGHLLQKQRDLSQPGQFAAAETVTLAGPKGCLERVRVLGPLRERTQVEISRSDAFHLGLNPPVRESGRLDGTSGITIVGPQGPVLLREGLIVARRHLHMSPADAEGYEVRDGENVRILAGRERNLIFDRVTVRVKPEFALELHLDTDEANAAGLGNGDAVYLLAPMLARAPGFSLFSETSGAGGPVKAAEALALITEEVVRRARRDGAASLLLAKGGLITPLACDTAKELGVQIAREVR